ncbi:MAG: DUF4843 domain-containing protein [Bacteroidales bacterium]|nr:DUF4843 domain-containing protein [Bacteroidales bacterium]
MKKFLPIIFIAALALFTSCKETWLLYDTDQKDKVYLLDTLQVHTASFALIPEDSILVRRTVHVLGSVKDYDRHFSIKAKTDLDSNTFVVASTSYPMVAGEIGKDYTVSDLCIPAGEVTGYLDIVLRRTDKMLDQYVKVAVELISNDEFDSFEADSSRNLAILTPEFEVYVTDGEPACPSWWRYANSATYPLGWSVYMGNFYPDKFRRMLDYLRDCETTAPTFYNYVVDTYGENLEDAPTNFMRQTYSSQWAKYVFIPLYEYYLAYYAENPDDENYEQIGDAYVNINKQVGWGDPTSGTYGFLN